MYDATLLYLAMRWQIYAVSNELQILANHVKVQNAVGSDTKGNIRQRIASSFPSSSYRSYFRLSFAQVVKLLTLLLRETFVCEVASGTGP